MIQVDFTDHHKNELIFLGENGLFFYKIKINMQENYLEEDSVINLERLPEWYFKYK
jgi:hypothetical protein